MKIRSFISGCEGTQLSPAETAFFHEQNPWGLILFKRNCETPAQIKALTAAFREAVGRKDAPVFIDQEGGRVQRLGPPSNYWRKYPLGPRLSAISMQRIRSRPCAPRAMSGRLMAEDLIEIGITADCLPVLDVPQAGRP